MTATCRQPCCALPRMTVSELVERGLQRNRAAPLAVRGDDCVDAEGNCVRFSLELAGAAIAGIEFKATSCATLIAFREMIAETMPRQRLDLARALSARDLVDALPGVHPLKRDRAVLAVAAFRSALFKVSNKEGAR